MKAVSVITCAAAGLAAVLAAGCDAPGGSWDLKNMVRKVMPPSSKQQAVSLFDPDDADRRRKAVETLSSRSRGLKEPYLERYALLLTKDKNALVRGAAARALGKAGDRKYLTVIAGALSDESATVRWDAACALDNVTGKEAIEPLRKRVVSDESMDVRLSSVRALRHYNEPRVVATLVRALSDREFIVRNRAHDVLVELKGVDHGYSSGRWLAEIKDLPPTTEAPAPAPAKESWWERLTKRDTGKKIRPEPPGPVAPAAKPAVVAPVARPAGAPKPAAAGPQRPWWDWLGLTDEKPKPAKESKKDPWWQRLGVKDEKGKSTK